MTQKGNTVIIKNNGNTSNTDSNKSFRNDNSD